MDFLVGISAAVLLIILRRVCQLRKLTSPPLRLPIIAAGLIPILNILIQIFANSELRLLTQALKTSVTLLWLISFIRLGTWLLLVIPSEFGWWKPIPKILRDLIGLAIATSITLILIQRDFQINLIGLAATSAVITAVIGLAAQETLKNLFAGISLQVDSPFEEGDWIDLGFTRGVVKSLRLMSTRILTLEGSLTVVPNSRIATEVLRRFKPGEPVGQTFEIGLDYNLPPRQAINLLQRTVSHNRKVLREHGSRVWVSEFGERAIVYKLLTWQQSALEQIQLRSDIMEQTWYALQRIGQTIPVPIRDIRTNQPPTRNHFNSITPAARIQRLKETEIFGHLNNEELRDLSDMATCISFAPGESVVRQGERGESLFIVVNGKLEVLREDSNHSMAHITYLEDADIFGEMALCTGEARTATIIAIQECILLEIQRQHLMPLMKKNPQIIETIGSLVAARRQQLKEISGSRAETRRQALIARMRKLFKFN